GHRSRPACGRPGCWRNSSVQPSELQTCFTRGSGNRCNAAVVEEPTTVEHHFVDAGGLGAVGQQLAETGSGGDRRPAALGAHVCLGGRCGHQRATCLVVDQLQRQVLVRTEHRETRTRRRAVDLLADPPVPDGPAFLTLLCNLAHRSLTSCRSCRPCGGPSHRGSARPCPCRARACGSSGCWRPPDLP